MPFRLGMVRLEPSMERPKSHRVTWRMGLLLLCMHVKACVYVYVTVGMEYNHQGLVVVVLLGRGCCHPHETFLDIVMDHVNSGNLWQGQESEQNQRFRNYSEYY